MVALVKAYNLLRNIRAPYWRIFIARSESLKGVRGSEFLCTRGFPKLVVNNFPVSGEVRPFFGKAGHRNWRNYRVHEVLMIANGEEVQNQRSFR